MAESDGVKNLPSLDDLSLDITKAESLSARDAGTMLTKLAAIQTILMGRMLSGNRTKVEQIEDKLLDVTQAAKRLSVSKDWLYRNKNKLPFTVRVSPGRVRFSLQGINKYIRSRSK